MDNTIQNTIGEIPLKSGESTAIVVRVGNTVRRSLSDNSAYVHKIYKELEIAGFEFSPRFLGVDDKNREIISFIDGIDISGEYLTSEIAVEAVKILKEFHDIMSNTALKGNMETVCHGDFSPWNLLHKDGQIIGVIDFDFATPGRRVTDLAYTCWTFLELGDAKWSDEDQMERIKILTKTYGKEHINGFVEELLNEQNKVLQYRKRRVDLTEDKEEKIVRTKIYKRIKQQIEWVEENMTRIEKAIR